MNFAHARQGLNNALRCLSKITQVSNVLVEADKLSISWLGRKPGILKDLYYPLEYQFLLDGQQYSVLLSDGSFFQFFYEFDASGVLKKGRLAFYPRPLSTRDEIEDIYGAAEDALNREDEDMYEHLYNWTELMDVVGKHPSNTSHIRFDYDCDVKAHSPAHLQFSGVHELRLAADFFPQPLAFVQLCESLILDGVSIVGDDVSFEKRHVMQLEKPAQLMLLACQSSV